MVNKNRLVKTFTDLVQIDSPSGDEDKIRKELTGRLKKLGALVEIDNYGNLIAHISGVGEPFLLNAHMDTVEPGRGIKPIVDGDVIKTDGSTILGGDPKAGVTAILEALTSLWSKAQRIGYCFYDWRRNWAFGSDESGLF